MSKSIGLFRGGHDFWGHALYKDQHFIHNTKWAFENAAFYEYVDFKNINLA
jgi:hypothetical protein